MVWVPHFYNFGGNESVDTNRTENPDPAPFSDENAIISSPLKIEAYAYESPGSYPKGTEIAGISWNDSYFDVRINLLNNADAIIQELDLILELDTNIAGVGQTTNVLSFAASPYPEIPSVWLEGKDEKGKNTSVPIKPIGQAISKMYRIYISKLLPASKLALVVASIALNSAPLGTLPEKLFAPRQKPKWLNISGTYELTRTKPSTRLHVTEHLPIQ